jgi:hypothetical protein
VAGVRESNSGLFSFLETDMSIPFTWVYLIYDPFTELYKIGKSDNPEARRKQLCCPGTNGTIAAAPTDYELHEAWLAPELTEAQLHEVYADCRVRGEWFHLTDEDLESLRYLLSEYKRFVEHGLKAVEDADQSSREWYEAFCQADSDRVLYRMALEKAGLLGFAEAQKLLYPAPTVNLDRPTHEIAEAVAGAQNAGAIDLLQETGDMAF